MQVFNVRFGLATNSSSSHSMIFLREGDKAFDYSGDSNEITDLANDNSAFDFCWQRFTLASKEAKLRYLGASLRSQLYKNLPHNVVDLICKNWLDGIEAREDYIDHQSQMFLPNTFGTNIPDEDFFKALKSYVLQENLIILGGNDNEGEHPLGEANAFSLPIPTDVGSKSKHVCRYDELYNFWTIFDPESGTKIRFRFSNDLQSIEQEVTKSSAPELVDVKITDFCPYGCEFCYQSSTTKGKHCDTPYSLISQLAELKVFEVALGGGEPTLHPQFSYILRQFREAGIVPNFTTKNLNWLRDPKKWVLWLESAGAFAYTPDTDSQIKELSDLVSINGIDRQRVNIHIVMGTLSVYEFRLRLITCAEHKIGVTLLGFKSYGFGANFEPQPYDWWIKAVKDCQSSHGGID